MNNRIEGWLDIAIYWDFYDFPRYILARDAHGEHWIFDGAFDDATDEYSDHFIMACVGGDAQEALRQFEQRIAIPRDADRSRYEAVALEKISFDPSRRQRMHIAA